MDEQMDISSERVDDIPLIVELLKQMEIAKWIDQQLKQPHGNHQGMSYGQLSVLLLTYIITQSDHRLCTAEEWINLHRQTLEMTTGWLIGGKDVTDDRLARVVEEFGLQEDACQGIEQKVGRHMIRAYELPTEVGRVDTTSFSVHHEQIESEADSLLRYGHSKDKRPDLLQYRQLLGTLDTAGIPLVSATLAGNGADDPLYWPTWQRMVKVIGHKQFVFLADCKAAAMATRAQISAADGIYCLPLPLNGNNPLLLKQWVLAPPTTSIDIRLPTQEEDEPPVGKGFEVELGKFWLNPDTKKCVTWHERYLVVYSNTLAIAQLRGLHERLDKAQAALGKLQQKPGEDLDILNASIEAILKRYRVKEFLIVTTTATTITQTRYVNKGRPTANSPTQEVTNVQLNLKIDRQTQAIEEAEQLTGWRLYVTNAPITRLSLTQAIVYYRDQWILERGFHRFKRGQLPALPIYFQNQDRIVGLMFLLTLALRVFTLIEFVVRLALKTSQQKLAGLYDGNPKRTTERPSAEQLLRAFDDITLYLLPDNSIFVTTLSALHRQILSLLKLPESIYHLHLKPRKT
jgi:transposase